MLATLYNNRSVAEQNSVDLAWNLLQDSNFADLQTAIYSTPEEKLRFRQLVVNAVMATDIADKELKALRNKRWEKAFNKNEQVENESAKDSTDRKATIVIEHLIQAVRICWMVLGYVSVFTLTCSKLTAFFRICLFAERYCSHDATLAYLPQVE